MFTDRDGKFQLLALAESGFDPLARTCRFMLTEEAHHMFVGQTGVGPRDRQTCAGDEAAPEAAILGVRRDPAPMIQSTSTTGRARRPTCTATEISSRTRPTSSAGLKGRAYEDRYDDHKALRGARTVRELRRGRLFGRSRCRCANAMNEVLRDEYSRTSEKGIAYWNKHLREARRRVPLPRSPIGRVNR
jgi:benzoyl-CoA 2,3-dioxygenase component B